MPVPRPVPRVQESAMRRREEEVGRLELQSEGEENKKTLKAAKECRMHMLKNDSEDI